MSQQHDTYSRVIITLLSAFDKFSQSTFPPTVNSSEHSCLRSQFAFSRRLMSLVSSITEDKTATFFKTSVWTQIRIYFLLWSPSAVWYRHLLLIIDTACGWKQLVSFYLQTTIWAIILKLVSSLCRGFFKCVLSGNVVFIHSVSWQKILRVPLRSSVIIIQVQHNILLHDAVRLWESNTFLVCHFTIKRCII